MEYTQLGSSGIKVSRLCLGCMSFGDPASKMHAWTLDPERSDFSTRQTLIPPAQAKNTWAER